MLCPLCQAVCTPEDNYCHRCGAPLKVRPLPVRRIEGLPARRPSLAPVMVRGLAYVALGALGHWALGAAARSLLRWAVRPLLSQGRPLPSPGARRLPTPRRTEYWWETIVVWRRLEQVEED